jgi:hypothetical protein
MSVVPSGLTLARSEHVSLTKIEEESLEEEHKVKEKEEEESGERDIG